MNSVVEAKAGENVREKTGMFIACLAQYAVCFPACCQDYTCSGLISNHFDPALHLLPSVSGSPVFRRWIPNDGLT